MHVFSSSYVATVLYVCTVSSIIKVHFPYILPPTSTDHKKNIKMAEEEGVEAPAVPVPEVAEEAGYSNFPVTEEREESNLWDSQSMKFQISTAEASENNWQN